MKDRRNPTKEIWISGINPVREALLSDRLIVREMILARDDLRIQALVEQAGIKRIPVRHGAKEAISELVGHSHHQGVAVRAEDYAYTPLEVILERASNEREPLVVLDCIQDPQNMGALARSACFLGAKGLIIPKDRSARVTSVVVRVSAGALSYLPVAQVVNLARALDQLKEAGIWTIGLDLQAAASLYETDLTIPLALVIGNEQKGLRHLIRKQCDLLARIQGHCPLQSLNAAAAGAIALAEVQRQRSGGWRVGNST